MQFGSKAAERIDSHIASRAGLSFGEEMMRHYARERQRRKRKAVALWLIGSLVFLAVLVAALLWIGGVR